METELIDPTGRWCLNPSQPRLSRLLASLRRFAIFDWTGFSNLKGLSTSNDRCVLSLALAAIAFRAKQRNGYGPFLLGMLAAAAVLLGKFVWESRLTMYSALGLLVTASLWNARPRAANHLAKWQCAPAANKKKCDEFSLRSIRRTP